nr:expressed protein [Hymenolepis microstoma]
MNKSLSLLVLHFLDLCLIVLVREPSAIKLIPTYSSEFIIRVSLFPFFISSLHVIIIILYQFHSHPAQFCCFPFSYRGNG